MKALRLDKQTKRTHRRDGSPWMHLTGAPDFITAIYHDGFTRIKVEKDGAPGTRQTKMKSVTPPISLFLFATLIAISAAGAIPKLGELVEAEPCNPDACKPPNCRCSTESIPGGLSAKDVPQVRKH